MRCRETSQLMHTHSATSAKLQLDENKVSFRSTQRGEGPQRIVTGGEGVFITDRDGNRLLDGFAGLYCVNVGYGRKEIAEAIADQARELSYYHAYAGHGSEASITLARMVMEQWIRQQVRRMWHFRFLFSPPQGVLPPNPK